MHLVELIKQTTAGLTIDMPVNNTKSCLAGPHRFDVTSQLNKG